MIFSEVNQYLGVNAHANGLLQSEHEWVPFHAQHIIDLRREIRRVLPKRYIAIPESSLQIEVLSDDDEQHKYPRPHTTIFDKMSRNLRSQTASLSPAGVAVPMLSAIRWNEFTLKAVVIYKTEDHSLYGRPVARVELLSPTNKLPSAGASTYIQSRMQALKSGLPLVEIDYLHHQRSTIREIPRYPDGPNANAYSIVVHDPRPSIFDGVTNLFLFGVDEPIPSIIIPLATGDVTGAVNFDATYNNSFFEADELHSFVDYSRDPVDFATYSAADQQRIRNRMQIVQAKAAQGVSLTDGPFTA